MEPYQIFRTWRRIYEKRIITRNGVYAENQLPDDYSGSQLEIEIVQRMITCDSAGHLKAFYFDDLNNVKDKDDNEGIGATIILPEHTITIEGDGPSEHIATWYLDTNTKLSEVIQSKAKAMYNHYLLEEKIIE